jgi:hypothetical protein
VLGREPGYEGLRSCGDSYTLVDFLARCIAGQEVSAAAGSTS